jgi:hypothetical protein
MINASPNPVTATRTRRPEAGLANGVTPRASYREVLSAARAWSSTASEVGLVAAAGGAECAADEG